MEPTASYKFKISSKKLSSGKCQVKFIVQDYNCKNITGYALVDSKVTLKDVVEQIDYQIKTRKYKPYFLNSLLLKSQNFPSNPIDYLIFNSK